MKQGGRSVLNLDISAALLPKFAPRWPNRGRDFMSSLDTFAWIVLVVLVASVIAVFCIAGWLPGHIAKGRGHPQAQAVTAAGWITALCGFALWPIALIWAFVDVPRTTERQS
jgi:hypothetical protein